MTGETQMLKYKYENSFYRFMSNSKEIIINEKNADWHLFQIGRDLMLTIGIQEQKKNRRHLEGSLPPSLFVNDFVDYNANEIDLLILTLKSIVHYLEKSEKPMKIENENIRTIIENIDQRIRDVTDEVTKHKLDMKKNEHVGDLHRNSHQLIHFVNELMSTRVLVEEGKIFLYSQDDELIKSVSDELMTSGKQVSIVTKMTAERW